MVYPIIYRVSTILLVVQDFATIHSITSDSDIPWLRANGFFQDFFLHKEGHFEVCPMTYPLVI